VTAEPFSLAGRVAAVTGAASGIGRATALGLARAGARVVVGDVDVDGLEATGSLVDAAGGERAVVMPADVSRKGDVDALVARAVADGGRLDVMANVAGIIHNSAIVETDEADLDRVLAVNLKGAFFGCQAALAAMAPQGSGSVVNMSSGGIDQPADGLACYAMSKAAIAMLTKTAAREGGRHGIRVNTVAPGFVLTAMTQRHYTLEDGSIDQTRMEAVLRPLRAASPLGIVGEAEDVANTVVYLASDAARFVTGQILRPNGGIVMPW
jgi:3-oxoacyl-[acyl-carrier protein] reductase